MPEPQKKVGWVPLFGDFEIASDQDITFKGKLVPVTPQDANPDAEPKMQPQFGMLLSSMTVADGDVSAEIEFESVIPATMCELAVAYDPNAAHVLTAGLGGEEWAMFGIREFGSTKNPKGWMPYRIFGNHSSMRAKVKYQVEARFRGAIVTLLIDGVVVASVEVSSPVGTDRQVGIMCRNDHDIHIRNLSVSRSKPKAFVVMQFGAEFDDVYTDVVQEVFKHYEGKIQRGDEVSGPGIVLTDIVRQINESQLVIADITPPNPNVYFEVGWSLAMKKPTILLAKKGTSLPFDIAGFRVLFYENSIGGKKKLEEGLRRHIDAILTAP